MELNITLATDFKNVSRQGLTFTKLKAIVRHLCDNPWYCDSLVLNSVFVKKNGAGNEARTRNFQLGILVFDPYFQYLQNCLEKIYMHALHTTRAQPDLRVAAGRLRDVCRF